jgi:hypothetical protein
MLFWLFIILTVVGIVLKILGEKHWAYDSFMWKHDVAFGVSGMILSAVGAAISIVMIIVISFSYCGSSAYVAEDQATYDSLIFKLENTDCRDELGLLNKEIIDEVQAWNETLAYHKTIQRDFWLGIFYPNMYDEFKLIDLNRFKISQGEYNE